MRLPSCDRLYQHTIHAWAFGNYQTEPKVRRLIGVGPRRAGSPRGTEKNMAKVCVITGGGSGMGLEVAKLMGGAKVVITGRTVAKLEGAVEEIRAAGVDAVARACDASDPASVDALVEYAKSLGTIKTVIHAAGVSPHMGDGAYIWKINACGTINVDEKFAAAMDEGGVILNVSSMSAYMLPPDRVPYPVYAASAAGTEVLEGAFAQVLANVPTEMGPGMAYTMSKNFVIWYTKQEAVKYGPKGIRVVSISPGTFTTPMGNLEGEEALKFATAGAMGRAGDPKEIARMMAFMVSDECSYLDGVDVLYDGGSVAALEVRRAQEAAAAQQQ